MASVTEKKLFSDSLSKSEKENLKKILGSKEFDQERANTVLVDSVLRRYKREHEESLFEFTEGNKELASLLITALERQEHLDRGKLFEDYVFLNEDPREDTLQRALLIDMVKNIRSLTGLSQAEFSKKYDVSKKTLQAWEIGAKKISKYTYWYLKNVTTENLAIITTVRQAHLPLGILDEESISYLKAAADSLSPASYAMVRHIEKSSWAGESYILGLGYERTESIENGKAVSSWECYPEGIKKCIRPIIPYNCTGIVFDFEKEHYNYYKDLLEYTGDDLEGKIREVMRKG